MENSQQSTKRHEAVLEPDYWRRRLREAKERNALHTSVYLCGAEQWSASEARTARILREVIGRDESVLDAGCGYGRLLDLMPIGWCGGYVGIDISPDMIALARERRPFQNYFVGDLRNLSFLDKPEFSPLREEGLIPADVAVLVSIRGMIVGQCGREVWDVVLAELRKYARRVLCIEYDDDRYEVL